MKKLPITKEAFQKSKYFNKKYGRLEYVSESGNLFKTNKGKVLKFTKESADDEKVKLSKKVLLDAIPVDSRDGLVDINPPDGSFGNYTWYVRFAPFSEDEAKVAADGITKSTGRRTTVASSGREVFVLVMDHPSRADESTKKLVKEGAGAGYTVHIKDLKLGNIIDKKLVKGTKRYDDYYECKVEVVPGEYEIEAEDYYNDFFWQEHELGEPPTANIDGGVATISYATNSYDEDEAEDELLKEVANLTLDISFDYGWGWTHVDLPREKIEADHVSVENREFYGNIDLLELNAPDLADAVNSGHQSIYDRDEDEEELEDDGEEYDESTKKVVKNEDDIMTESYNDEWAEVGAAFDEFRGRLWKYTRKDRESRMEFFQDCMKKCEGAFKEYHDSCVAED